MGVGDPWRTWKRRIIKRHDKEKATDNDKLKRQINRRIPQLHSWLLRDDTRTGHSNIFIFSISFCLFSFIDLLIGCRI